MFYAIYGKIIPKTKVDLLITILKIPYILFTLPCLIFIILTYVKGLGGIKMPKKKEITKIDKVLTRISVVLISFGLWIGILSLLEKSLNFKIRLHLL